MQKIKLHTGLASLMLVASIFGGWQVVLLTSLFILLFADVDDNVKNVTTRVITFMIGFTIVSLLWNVIYSGVDTVSDAISSLANIINNFKDYNEQVNFSKVTVFINNILPIVDNVIDILLTLAKVGFVVAILTSKPAKTNAITTKINEYVSKATNFVASFNNTQQQ